MSRRHILRKTRPPTPQEVRCPKCKKVSLTKRLKLLGTRRYCPYCNAYLGTNKELWKVKA